MRMPLGGAQTWWPTIHHGSEQPTLLDLFQVLVGQAVGLHMFPYGFPVALKLSWSNQLHGDSFGLWTELCGSISFPDWKTMLLGFLTSGPDQHWNLGTLEPSPSKPCDAIQCDLQSVWGESRVDKEDKHD